MSDGHVLVIGAAGIDLKARFGGDGIVWEQSNPGVISNSVGGVARNIGENLARLDVKTILLTAVGHDRHGKRVLNQCAAGGMDVSKVRVLRKYRTGTYITLLKPNGKTWDTVVAVHDYDVLKAVNRAYLLRHIGLFAGAELIVIDANLSDEALATVFELSTRFGIRVAADPTTPQLAGRLCDFLPYLYLITPNASETHALCGLDFPARERETAVNAARSLVQLGVRIAVVTVGEHGLAYADSSVSGFVGAPQTQVIDPTGGGDALTGALIFGLLNDVGIDEAVRLGATAAALTVQSKETVLPELSVELLYDKLIT
ncbi:MAG: carbohydrate kinase family protein [bacterium]|nr:carbohydrate kinase family protein [bacterium]